ncbi:MAG TPA: GIY-YIG nuclease family protein [Candidatus Acidoferrum sp.]|nr:GIY-YIG nuclease family protein [Candidatus Acidoferrum sp.]
MAVYHVYILASASGVLYTGVTNCLERRVAQHKAKLCPGFTAAYDVTRLVYFEPFTDVRAAISREKQIKNWRREKKLVLIRALNPAFRDLSADFPGATNSKRASTKPDPREIAPCLDPSTPARQKPPVLRSG